MSGDKGHHGMRGCHHGRQQASGCCSVYKEEGCGDICTALLGRGSWHSEATASGDRACAPLSASPSHHCQRRRKGPALTCPSSKGLVGLLAPPLTYSHHAQATISSPPSSARTAGHPSLCLELATPGEKLTAGSGALCCCARAGWRQACCVATTCSPACTERTAVAFCYFRALQTNSPVVYSANTTTCNTNSPANTGCLYWNQSVCAGVGAGSSLEQRQAPPLLKSRFRGARVVINLGPSAKGAHDGLRCAGICSAAAVAWAQWARS